MSVNIRSVSAADQVDWDNYIEQHPLAGPYHKFAWLQAVKQAYGHEIAGFIALEHDKVVGVLPAILMKTPLVKPKLCSLPFCDVGHAVADNDSISAQLQQAALASLNALHGHSFEYRDTEQSVTDEELLNQKVRMILDLPESADALMDSFKSKLRSQVRKAEKNGLTCTIAVNPQAISNFYSIFANNMRKLGSPVHAKHWFEALFQYYADDIFLAVVYYQATPIGAGIVIKKADKIAIPWASTDAAYNYLAPNMLLYWNLLRHACELGCKQFDFGRSTFGEGTYKFKQQWGARPVPLKWRNLGNNSNDDNAAGGDKSKLRKVIETLWSRLPLALTTTLGPRLRKHISL